MQGEVYDDTNMQAEVTGMKQIESPLQKGVCQERKYKAGKL